MKYFFLIDPAGVTLRQVGVSAGEPEADPDGTWVEAPGSARTHRVELVNGEFVSSEIDEDEADVFARAKHSARAQINRHRNIVEFGSFVWDGSAFDADQASQQRVTGAVVLAMGALQTETPFQIDWTLADNTIRSLSALEFIGVGQALGAHVNAAHAAATALKIELEAAATLADIAAILAQLT